ncbi:MAG: CPBP family intramembrane metalloprotease [Chitinophagaceae bacterium]
MEDEELLTGESEAKPRPRHTIQYTPSSQFGILVGMAFVGLILGSLLGLVPALISGVSLLTFASNMDNPAYTNLIRLMQLISTVCTFLFPVWIYQRVVRPPKDFLHVRTHSSTRLWLLVIGLAFASMPVTDLMGTINQVIPIPTSLAKTFQQIEDNYNTQVMAMMRMNGVGDLLISLFIIALLPAVLEETFFRGGFQNILVQWVKKPFWAILITSVVFSAIHGSYYGFLPRAFLGLLLGYVYCWTKDLKMNILIHFINNATSVVTMYVLSQKKQLTPENMNESLPWYWQLGGLVLFVFVAWRVRERSSSNPTPARSPKGDGRSDG